MMQGNGHLAIARDETIVQVHAMGPVQKCEIGVNSPKETAGCAGSIGEGKIV